MKTKPVIPITDEYKNFLDLLALHAEASNRLELLAAQAQDQLIGLIDNSREEYAELQAKILEVEPLLEQIARQHPEWFPENRKSIKTPYATVSFRSSTKLSIANEEASILLVQKHCTEEEQERYIRKEERLNLDALRGLSDDRLKALRIERVPDENFNVKPAKLDLGKAAAPPATA